MAKVLHSSFRREISWPQERLRENIDPAPYREFVFRCALSICGEPDGAEDVAQEVLLILCRSHKSLVDADNPEAWVRRVTVRCAVKHLKRRRLWTQIPTDLKAAEGFSESLAVYEVLCCLSAEDRALLGMALNQGLTYREMGDALGIPEGTVASRLNAAKKSFQKRWKS
jgi:RNA polymerase sigma-70 factor (ECF subfamily)